MELKLICSCSACPEQYDVFRGEERVAYLRLRHGCFTAELIGPGGELVYTACPDGDGRFTNEERHHFLNCACRAILDALAGKKPEDEPPLYFIEERKPVET